MNKKISLGAAITFMIVVAGITFCITMMVALNHFNTMVSNVKEREAMYQKISNIDAEIRQYLYGAENIDEGTLNDMIATGYIYGIGDKYASYLTKSQYEAYLQEEDRQLVSIGVTLTKDETGYLKVRSVQANSPAEQNGIERGDLLISVDGVDLNNLSLERGEQLLKGSIGTKVTVVYRRDGADTSKELQRISLREILVEGFLYDHVGYIKIHEFNSSTYVQFKEVVEDLMARGALGLIFDVRGNNSDSIYAANDALNLLVASGDFGTIHYANGTSRLTGTSDSYSIELPMAVLVDGTTGCAAEYFAETLREYEKASVIGTQTMGKAAMQEIRPLNDGSALKFTVSRFTTPNGTDIEGVGIKPDYEVEVGEIQEIEELKVETDAQLRKAFETVRSKVVIIETPEIDESSEEESDESSKEGDEDESSEEEESSKKDGAKDPE